MQSHHQGKLSLCFFCWILSLCLCGTNFIHEVYQIISTNQHLLETLQHWNSEGLRFLNAAKSYKPLFLSLFFFLQTIWHCNNTTKFWLRSFSKSNTEIAIIKHCVISPQEKISKNPATILQLSYIITITIIIIYGSNHTNIVIHYQRGPCGAGTSRGTKPP